MLLLLHRFGASLTFLVNTCHSYSFITCLGLPIRRVCRAQTRCMQQALYGSQCYACPKEASGLSMVVLKGTMEIRGSRNTAMNAAAYSHPPVNHGSCFL